MLTEYQARAMGRATVPTSSPSGPAPTAASIDADPTSGYKQAQAELDALKKQYADMSGWKMLPDEVKADIERKIAQKEADIRRDFYDATGERFEGVPTDPHTQERARDLGDLRTREIDQGLASAERGITQGYSRRGMGGSGYAADTQSKAMQTAAEERARARASAFDQAVAEGQRGILGNANIAAKGDPLLMMQMQSAEQQYQNVLAQAAADRNAYRKFFGELVGDAAGYGMDYAEQTALDDRRTAMKAEADKYGPSWGWEDWG
ncbi:MAG: hypothetical protein ACM3UX_00605 [Candidatus Woesearchaeota archaeon]